MEYHGGLLSLKLQRIMGEDLRKKVAQTVPNAGIADIEHWSRDGFQLMIGLQNQLILSDMGVNLEFWSNFPELFPVILEGIQKLRQTKKGYGKWKDRSDYETTYGLQTNSVRSVVGSTTVTNSFGNSSNPLLAVVQKKSQVLTTASFLSDVDNHYLKTICVSMNETFAWKKLLEKKGLLSGEGVEKWVAALSGEWENTRKNNPALQVLTTISSGDPDFANLDLYQFGKILTGMGISKVDEEVVKFTSWLDAQTTKSTKKNTAAYNAQNDLRNWFIKNGICDDGDVDSIVQLLRSPAVGVSTVEDLRHLEKQDLKDAGISIAMANKIIRVFKA